MAMLLSLWKLQISEESICFLGTNLSGLPFTKHPEV